MKMSRLPIDPHGDDEYCSYCRDDTVITVIKGKTNCHMCGNQINLCSSCFFNLKREFSVIAKQNGG